jgi:(S)-sulfolactate dehydrogenase
MPDILITEFMDDNAVEDLRRDFDVLYDPELFERDEEILSLIPYTSSLIVRNRTQVRTELLEKAKRLIVVGRLGVGLDNIDVADCARRGIALSTAKGAVEASVAEYVIGAILLLLRRRMFTCSAEVLEGKWPRQSASGFDMMGRTLGLVAFGTIGREVAARAHAMGMQIIAYDPFLAEDDPIWRQADVRRCEFDMLLAQADVVSIHTPLTSESRGLMGAAAIAKMKLGAFLVNTSRGGIVDEVALVDALQTGKIAAAAIDVFATEPLPEGSLFAGVPNLLLSPHVAGLTKESAERVGRAVTEGVRRVLAGRRA